MLVLTWSCDRHWYDVPAFHYISDGTCTFVLHPPAASGEESKASEGAGAGTALKPLRLVCSKGAVVSLAKGVPHSFTLSKDRYLKMVGMYNVEPDSIVPHVVATGDGSGGGESGGAKET